MDKKCKYCRDKFLDYYYCGISSSDKSFVDEHLAQCVECKNYYNELISALDSIEVEKITLTEQEKNVFIEKFHRRISTFAAKEKATRQEGRVLPVPWFVKVTTVCAPAILLLLLLFKIWAFYRDISEINGRMEEAVKFYTDRELIDLLDLLENLDFIENS